MTTAPADAVDLPSLSTGHAQFDSDQALIERLGRFNKAHGVEARLAEERLFRQAKAAPTAAKRLIWLQRAADTVSASVERSQAAACKEGCSHCCFITVSVSDVEAAALARSSGRQLAAMPERSVVLTKENFDLPVVSAISADAMDRFYGVPCPFLVDNRCSQYESRPLPCRHQFSLAEDDGPCVIGNVREKVPYLNLMDRKARSVLALGMGRRYADIRDWFPS